MIKMLKNNVQHCNSCGISEDEAYLYVYDNEDAECEDCLEGRIDEEWAEEDELW